MKDFILYKILRRKKPEPTVEPEKFDILATFYMKDGKVHKIVGTYESSKALMQDISRIMDDHDVINGITPDSKRLIIRTNDIEYVEVETEAYEA